MPAFLFTMEDGTHYVFGSADTGIWNAAAALHGVPVSPLPACESAQALDADTLDGMTRGFVTALLWADAQPLPPYTVQEANFHQGWKVMGPDGREDANAYNNCHATYEQAEQAAAKLNEQDDDYTGESGGLENREPTAELTEVARVLCARFLAANPKDITLHMEVLGDPDGGHPGEFVGHTFYLESAGHGISFTDHMPRDYQAWQDMPDDQMTPALNRLSEATKGFGEVEHLMAYELADGTVGL